MEGYECHGPSATDMQSCLKAYFTTDDTRHNTGEDGDNNAEPEALKLEEQHGSMKSDWSSFIVSLLLHIYCVYKLLFLLIITYNLFIELLTSRFYTFK